MPKNDNSFNEAICVNVSDVYELVELTGMTNGKNFSMDENYQEEAFEAINSMTIDMKIYDRLDEMPHDKKYTWDW